MMRHVFSQKVTGCIKRAVSAWESRVNVCVGYKRKAVPQHTYESAGGEDV
jgi:hypothetical protein